MISVILCGGAGSRLWPVSREEHPKPFIRLPDGLSFIQKVYLRAVNLPWTESVLTITSGALYLKILEEFKGTGVDKRCGFILEPFGRNTAPAVAAATLEVAGRYGPDMPLLILAADHLISDYEAFREAAGRALELALGDRLVTFGIKPDAPETGFGYIEAQGDRVLRFVEKPSLEKAREYVDSARFFWNAGLFCFKAGVMLEEMRIHAPALLKAVENCQKLSAAKRSSETCLELDHESFGQAPKISIDYAVMEKSDRVAVVPCDIGWADIGSWTRLCAMNECDERGNHFSDPHRVVPVDTSNCDIQAPERLVATIGLDNILIVDTPDALLVADKSRDQEVKEIYDRLKEAKTEEYRTHRTVHRPWGTYTVLRQGPRFKIKHIEIKPGGTLSLQLHHHRSEHWVVVSGMAEVTKGDEVFFVDTNESTYIKAGIKHRVANNGILPLVMIEIQSGDYLGEDDIVRIDDVYGRVDKNVVVDR